MPKATELITSDHRRVEELFERFERDPSRELALEICDELETHTQVEEQILYPELRKVDEDLWRDAKEEHEEVDELIEQVQGTDDLDQIRRLIAEMKEKVQHHVDDEESEDLPTMEEACGEDRMEELGQEIAEWKRQHAGPETRLSRQELVDLTKEELYERAKQAGVDGRSDMTKDELIDELSRR